MCVCGFWRVHPLRSPLRLVRGRNADLDLGTRCSVSASDTRQIYICGEREASVTRLCAVAASELDDGKGFAIPDSE